MDICKGLNKIYEQKNHDYGDSFHDTFVEEGMAMARIRLSDKLNRFKKLSREGSEQKVNDESIRDTLLDLANYAIMTVMEMDILVEAKDVKTRLKETLNELPTKDSLLNKTFQIPDPDPCKKCTYPAKATCGGCMDRVEWERRRKEGQIV
jgi:hypothetical protein